MDSSGTNTKVALRGYIDINLMKKKAVVVRKWGKILMITMLFTIVDATDGSLSQSTERQQWEEGKGKRNGHEKKHQRGGN